MHNRILAIVVTFFPDKELLEKNILAFIDNVDKVLVWENTPKDKKLKYRYLEDSKVEYCGDGINSISHALNYAWHYAVKKGYNYILTMDQDSVWKNFKGFLEKTVYDRACPKGIWGPAIVANEENVTLENKIIVTDVTITSGMLMDVDLITKVKGWNERFFIDCVDNEFCLKSQKMGIKIYQLRFTDIYLLQHYGKPHIVHFGKYYSTLRNDTSQRLYSIFKSHIMLFRLFAHNKKLRYDFNKYWVKKIKWIFFFENNRFEKMLAILRGIFAGISCDLKEYSQYNSGKQVDCTKDKVTVLYDIFIGSEKP
jgi:rhamnosyltransferase